MRYFLMLEALHVMKQKNALQSWGKFLDKLLKDLIFGLLCHCGRGIGHHSLNILQRNGFLSQLFVTSQVTEACVDRNPVKPTDKGFIVIKSVEVGENFHKNILDHILRRSIVIRVPESQAEKGCFEMLEQGSHSLGIAIAALLDQLFQFLIGELFTPHDWIV